MENKFNIWIAIIFFPIAIIFLFFKLIIHIVDSLVATSYIKNINVSQIDTLDGYAFEDFLYYLFKSSGVKVYKTSKSHDYGADLVIENKSQKIIVQSKLYYNHNVGNSAIQEISTAKKYYNANTSVVITNSDFTRSAIALATSNSVILINRAGLVDLINSNKAKRRSIINSWNFC